MRVVILGTGDAFTATSFGSSAVLEAPAGPVLLDCPDPIHRVIAEARRASGVHLDAARIGHVLLTHLHGDHSNGLESLGFASLVRRLNSGDRHDRPAIHTHRAAADRLWEKLAPAMDAPLTPGGPRATLEDFFAVRLLGPDAAGDVAGLSVEVRPTRHPVPTVGLRITANGRTLGWSGDTGFDPEHIAWLSEAHLIVHECAPGAVHTNAEDLMTLPAELRARMRLIHVSDGYDPASLGCDIPVLRAGDVLEV